MITVKNDRIRVTVTQEVWDSFADRAKMLAHTQTLPSGDERVNTVEQVQRGLVLSVAMSKIGNASEFKALERESIDDTVLFNAAKIVLMRNYLIQHGRYGVNESIMRFENGYRMSQGMQNEVLEAEAYAQGHLSPLSTDDARSEIIDFIKSDVEFSRRELNFKKKLMDLKIGSGEVSSDGAAALAEAAETLNFFRENELGYRKSRSNIDGWEIEVIGEMPGKIGTCRYIDGSQHAELLIT